MIKVQYISPYIYPRVGQILPLNEALEPDTDHDAAGMIEQVERDVRNHKKTIGRLLALLVEKRIITFDEALEIAGLRAEDYRLVDS